MNFLIVMAVLLCVMLLVVLFCVWFRRFVKKQAQRAETANQKGIGFDERQVASQGKASDFTVLVGGVYFMAVYFLLNIWDLKHIEPAIKPATLVIGGCWLMYLSFNLYCMMTDSLIPMGNLPISTWWSVVCGALVILSVAIGTEFFRVPLTGENSYKVDQMFFGFFSFSNGIINLIAESRSKRNAE